MSQTRHRVTWRTRMPIRTTLLIVAVGTLVAAILLLFYRPDDGPILRSIALPLSPVAATLDEQTGQAFVLPFANMEPIYIVNVDTGQVVSDTLTGNRPIALVADARTGRAYFTAADGAMHVLDTSSGRELRSITLPVAMAFSNLLTLDARSGRVFVAGNKQVGILDARDGRLLGTTRLSAHLSVYPQDVAVDLANGHVFVAGYMDVRTDGIIDILDATSGRIEDVVPLPRSPSPGSLTVDERAGRVSVLDRDNGALTVLDARSGRVLYTRIIGMPLSVVMADAASGRLYVAISEGTPAGRVVVLDEASGRTLHTIAVGQDTLALVSDAATGHVLVVDGGGIAPTGSGAIRVIDGASGRVVRVVRLAQHPQAVAVGTRRLVVAGETAVPVTAYDPWAWLPAPLRRRLPFIGSPSAPRLLPGRVDVLDMRRL